MSGEFQKGEGGRLRFVRTVKATDRHVDRLRTLLQVLATVRAPGLPQRAQVQTEGKRLVMTYELTPGKLLSEHVVSATTMERAHILRWSGQIALAIGALHRLRPCALVHGEINSSRIWIDFATQEAYLLDHGQILEWWDDGQPQNVRENDAAAWAKLVSSLQAKGVDISLPSLGVKAGMSLSETLIPWRKTPLKANWPDDLTRLGQQLVRCSVTALTEFPETVCPNCERPTTGRFCATCATSLRAAVPSPGVRANSISISFDTQVEEALAQAATEHRWSHLGRARQWKALETLDSDTGFQNLRAPQVLPQIGRLRHPRNVVQTALVECAVAPFWPTKSDCERRSKPVSFLRNSFYENVRDGF